MDSVKFDREIKFGVATASSQIEGGDTNSNWNDWYKKGMIKDNSNPARANNHYVLFKQDIDLMASLNIQTYRMSLEWSRLEPLQGKFCEDAINHYKEEIKYLKSKNILPLVTMHHFNNPMWFEELGGFLNKDSPYILNAFIERMTRELGDLVNEFVTVNEPNVFATSAYYFGEFPPGEKSISKTITCMTHFAKAHILAYKSIHRIRKDMGYNDTLVGYASHLRVFEPKRKNNILDKIGAKLMDTAFQGALDETAMTGVRKFPIKRDSIFKKGKYYDFIGINYYSRSLVKVFTEGAKDGVLQNDMGWEIYPQGIKFVCERYFNKYNAPIYITENGTADREDKIRSQFIYDHLKELASSNAYIKRYYHWTFIDNFEWMDGERECFGLVKLNYQTQERTVRRSGHFYSEIIKNNGVTNDLIKKYLE